MKKALIIAKWEFITTVTRRTYIFAVIAMPLFYIAIGSVAALSARSASTTAGRIPTALVDRTGIVDVAFASALASRRDDTNVGDVVAALSSGSRSDIAAAAAGGPSVGGLVAYDDLDAAVAALRAQKVGAVYVVDADYLKTGDITAYAREGGLFTQQSDRRRDTQIADAIRASLLKKSLSGDELARAYAPAGTVKRMRVTARGIEDSGGFGALGPFAGTMGVTLLLTMSIFFSAGVLQQATAADRQNRIIEILLSSVDSDQLLVGKVMGLGGAALLQVAIYIGLIIVPGATVFALFQVPLGKVAIALAYFVVGYLLFACLMAGTGMLGRTSQESAQLSALWTLTAMSPWFFIQNVGTFPNGPIARALSFFPLSSPVTMMLRLGMTDVPLTDILLSLAIDVVAIYVTFRSASHIFRTASLMYGKRATLPEFVRWLRVS
jgi:ABC-2 type transport system permease protein